MVAINTATHMDLEPLILSDCRIWRNNFFETGKVDIKGLPYFRLRDALSSKGNGGFYLTTGALADCRRWIKTI